MAITLPFLALYVLLSLGLAYSDMRTGLLPDRLTCPLLWSGLLYHQCFFPEQLDDALWGAVAGYGGFAGIYWVYRLVRKREGLGYGDVKYLAALGAWHGWIMLPFLVSCAALLACFSVFTMAFIRGSVALKNPQPFGPFLAAAGFIMGYQNLTNEVISWSL